jgi:hypothetical protein
VVRSPRRLLAADAYHLNVIERIFCRLDRWGWVPLTTSVAGTRLFPDEFNEQAVRCSAGASRSEALTINFVFVFSLILAGLAVVGVFIEIPFISNYAFWVAIAAYVLLAGLEHRR